MPQLFHIQIINLQTVVFKQIEVFYLTLKTCKRQLHSLSASFDISSKSLPLFSELFFFIVKVNPYLTLIILATARGNNTCFLISPV